MIRRHHPGLRPSRAITLATLVGAAALFAGCGSGSSSSTTSSSAASTSGTASTGKPSYCASLSKLEASVKAIPSADEVKKNGTNALKSAVSQVQMNASTVVSEAKTQFASQTSVLNSSVDTLSKSVQQMASPPTASELAALPAQLVAVSTATKNLKESASPTCG